MKHDLEKGYDNTGYIPEEFDDLSKITEMEKDEKSEEIRERKFAKMYGGYEEEDVGGFLERNNKCDRY